MAYFSSFAGGIGLRDDLRHVEQADGHGRRIQHLVLVPLRIVEPSQQATARVGRADGRIDRQIQGVDRPLH